MSKYIKYVCYIYVPDIHTENKLVMFSKRLVSVCFFYTGWFFFCFVTGMGIRVKNNKKWFAVYRLKGFFPNN